MTRADVEGNTLRFWLDIRGIRDLMIVLSVAMWDGKGFVYDTQFVSSTTIGSGRQDTIYHMLDNMLSECVLGTDQPEGRYFFSSDSSRILGPRINRSDLVPLYLYTEERRYYRDTSIDTIEVFQYQDNIIATYDYGQSFIDESDRMYRLVRKVTDFEQKNHVLYTREYGDDFASLADTQDELDNLQVFDERVQRMPTPYPVGTVLRLSHTHRHLDNTALVVPEPEQARATEGSRFWYIEESGQTIQSDVMNSRWEEIDQPFQEAVNYLVMQESEHYPSFYIAILEREHYVAVNRLDGEPFREHYLHHTHEQKEKFIRKSDLVKFSVPYREFEEVGRKLLEDDADTTAQIFATLLKKTYRFSQKETYLVVGMVHRRNVSLPEYTLEFVQDMTQDRFRWEPEFMKRLISKHDARPMTTDD